MLRPGLQLVHGPVRVYYSAIWNYSLCTNIMTFLGIFAINCIFYPSLPHQFSEWFFFLSIYSLILVIKYSSEAQVKTIIFSQSSNSIIKVFVFFPKEEKTYTYTYTYTENYCNLTMKSSFFSPDSCKLPSSAVKNKVIFASLVWLTAGTWFCWGLWVWTEAGWLSGQRLSGCSASSLSAGVICSLQRHQGLCQNGFALCSSGLARGGLEGEMLRPLPAQSLILATTKGLSK